MPGTHFVMLPPSPTSSSISSFSAVSASSSSYTSYSAHIRNPSEPRASTKMKPLTRPALPASMSAPCIRAPSSRASSPPAPPLHPPLHSPFQSPPAVPRPHSVPVSELDLQPVPPAERLRPPPPARSMPLEVRLRALEARVLGVPASQLRPQEGKPGPTLARRVAAANRAVEEAVAASPQIRVLYERYDTYAPLLRVGLDDAPGDDGAASGGLNPADVLPPQAKAAMVLEAREELADAERGLREIALLERRGVAGAGGLEEIVTLAPALDTARTRLSARRRTLADTRADVASLVERYTEFTSTVSDLFVTLHDQLAALEEEVARTERRRADEDARIF